MIRDWANKKQLAFSLVLSSLVGIGFFIYCAAIDHTLAYDFLLWNLVLAWIPLFISIRLVYVLGYKLWSSWEALLLSFLWIIFIPNSFYMITDFIHLQTVPIHSLIYYVVAFTSIIYSAVLIGFISLYMIHAEFIKRFSTNTVRVLIALILATCSVAIYIGRDLRWDSWAVLTNPGGLIFDTSNRLIHVSDYPTAFATSSMFFILLGSMYFIAWSGVKAIKHERI